LADRCLKEIRGDGKKEGGRGGRGPKEEWREASKGRGSDEWERAVPFSRNRNCRLRFESSIVSKSITSMSFTPDKARFFRISHPRPPAPTTNTRACGKGGTS